LQLFKAPAWSAWSAWSAWCLYVDTNTGAQLVRAAGLTIDQAPGLAAGLAVDQAPGLAVDQEKKRAPVGALVGLARSARLVVVYAATACKGMVRY
jgi:hypothetical protein